MVFRFHDGQSLRATIEHEAPLYYSLRDTAGNPLVVSRDRVRKIVPLADVEPCPDAFSGAATDPGHSWDGDACALCGKSRKAAPASAEQASATDDTAMQALSDAGAQCGDCGDQPGDRICPDCERCYGWYVAALRKAGWAPRTETLNEATEAARSEYLHEDTGTPEDEAYNQGITDAVAAIGALLEAASSSRTAADEQPETAVEFGVRTPDGDVLTSTQDREAAVQRQGLLRHQYPDAVLVQRTVRYGPWTEATS